MILGIDEVGRGPWAGPLVVGAVVLGCEIEGLTDSKKLSAKKREALALEIHENATAVGLGWVHADEIDQIGLSLALVEATKRAVSEITTPYHEIIIDGTVNFMKDTGKGPYVTTLKKADLLIPSVSAASIVAKVARDKFMSEQHVLYPDYGFDSHVGYGTAAHRLAIDKYGVTPLHRLSFAPLAKYQTDQDSRSVSTQNGFAQGLTRAPASGQSLAADVLSKKRASTPSTAASPKQIRDAAETAMANYLVSKGFNILERNWKTKFCEIDIVAEKDGTIYFIEVKHRKTTRQGGGIGAVTPKKLHKMTFAAQLYAKAKRLEGVDMRLVVATTVGSPPELENYIELP
jgi:ribonuclease HII